MARKTFTWENFPYEFIKAIVYGKQTPQRLRPAIAYSPTDFDRLIPYINRICEYPDESFVRRYRKSVEDYFLNGTNYLIDVVKRCQKLNYGGIKIGSNDEMMFTLRNKRLTETLCSIYLAVLISAGKNVVDDSESIFTAPRTVDLSSAESDSISLFPYQRSAVEAMKKYYFDEDGQSAILSMPTGSGKTRTSVYFLLTEMISRGYQVIWLCHRSMLLEQAAEQFYRFSPVIKEYSPKEQFKMVCISGKHATVRAMQSDDDLIVSTVQSMCNSTEYLPNILGDKVIIVVDEAHHTLAPSYRRIIKSVRSKCRSAKLLGLTATPVRLTEKATGMLMKLFDNKIVYSIAMSELIANGTLSKPNYISRDTNVDIETMIDIDERKYIQKWGELPETLLSKVAKTNERNEFIVDEYVCNKEKYGKTIIFALNAIHCDTLNEQFKKRGIRSGYVYTQINDSENRRTIERFRSGDLDVLININILTEGSDIPDIQTVFLTRPTQSDALLMQMVGRGMRGSGCGGTDTVNIVDFCDKWTSISGWMNPKFVIGEEEPEEYDPIYTQTRVELIPIGAIRDIVKGITYKGAFNKERTAVLPVGWYDVIDEDGSDTRVIVFENQLSGYEKFRQDTGKYIKSRTSADFIIAKYFRTFGMLPNKNDLENMLRYIDHEGEFPEFRTFAERDEIEPLSVARKIKENDLPFTKSTELIHNTFESHKELIESIYGDKAYYTMKILECLNFENGIRPILTKVEEVDKQTFNLSGTPMKESLYELLTEVIHEMSSSFPKEFKRPDIYWTEYPVGSYYGVYYHEYNMIQINSLLNSVSVPREVVKFVIYHECLHQEIQGHPREFREKEHLYPDFQKHQYFLDYTLKDIEFDPEI